jgi:hypothetical protein
MKRIVFLALSLAAAVAFTSVATAAAPSGSVVSNGPTPTTPASTRTASR